MKKLFKLFMLSVLLLLVAACGTSKTGQTKEDKVYVIGTNAEYPPFEYLENDQVCGLDADIISAIAQKLNIQYKWSNTNFDGLILALQTKKMDGSNSWNEYHS